MNNHEIIIAVLLLMVACTPTYVCAVEQNHGCSVTQNMQNESDRFKACHNRQDKLPAEKKPKESAKRRDIGSEEERNRKLLNEIENNSTDRLKKQDQQVDVLEKLLLESTPGTSRPHSH